MPVLNWTVPALDDLRAIEAWPDENAPPGIAVSTLSAIYRRARFLENFPRSGRPLKNGLRALRVLDTPHVMLYRLSDAQIVVLRVHHEREDWLVEP
jgi:plasmid stabilization system protein ParE